MEVAAPRAQSHYAGIVKQDLTGWFFVESSRGGKSRNREAKFAAASVVGAREE